MKTFKRYISAAIGFALLTSYITLSQAQTISTNSNNTNRKGTKRITRGFDISSPGSAGSADSNVLNASVIEAAAALPVLGGGTLGRLTKWTGLTSSNSIIADSTIFEDKFGMVGIGTDLPTSKLTVAGMVQITLGGLKFPDGTVQTTAGVPGLQSVIHEDTLTGNGTAGSPLGVAVPLFLVGRTSQTPLQVTSFTNDGVTAIVAQGGQTFNANVPAGTGISGNGGNANVAGGIGGTGILGQGGVSGPPGTLVFSGGPGVVGVGGFSLLGGDGVQAYGFPNSDKGQGGTGLVAFGGAGSGSGYSAGNGITAIGGVGQNGASDGFAGYFSGPTVVYGSFQVQGDLNVSGGTKNFKIDHPLDPENKYLYHAAVESSEVLNIYSGNITTDESGEAQVTLPDWFEAINRDFRYQLTVVGTFAQAIVADEIKGNHFKIKTNAPGVKVSWQITGIRSDAGIRKQPFKIEEEKPQAERGTYLAPEAFDQPKDKGIEWMRNSQLMMQLKRRPADAEQIIKVQKSATEK